MVLLLVLLPHCSGPKKKEKAKVFVEDSATSSDRCDVESVYRKQSLKEAAFSAIRRQVNTDTEGDAQQHMIKKLEARCADIPVLVDAQPLPSMFVQVEGGGLCMAYETSLPADQVELFYQREMEREGWQREAQLHGTEILLVYKKPGKKVVISVRLSSEKAQKSMLVVTQMHVE